MNDRKPIDLTPTSETSRADGPPDASDERRPAGFASIVAVIGLWVALSVFVYDVGTAAVWNNVAVGLTVFLAGGYNYYRLSNGIPRNTGIAALVAALGLWLLVGATLLELTGGSYWSTAGSGLVVTCLSGYDAYESREARAIVSDSDRG